MGGFNNFVKDYIYHHINLDNGRRNGRRNGCRNGRIYKAQKSIDYRAASADQFNGISKIIAVVGV